MLYKNIYGQEIFVNRPHYISIDLTTNLDFCGITNVAAMTFVCTHCSQAKGFELWESSIMVE